MTRKIMEIEGIGAAYAGKLHNAGVLTIADMLEKAASPLGRALLAERTGISGALILRWANHADLMRISGVGPQYAELLEAAGVDSVKELAQRNPANLAAKLAQANGQRRLAGKSPAESQVSDWIGQAAQLEPRISH